MRRHFSIQQQSFSFETVMVMLNQGDGSFADPLRYAVNFNPVAIVTADFDGDGSTDLAVATAGEGVNLLHNQGDGTFIVSPPYGEGALDLALADLNGDGALDLAVANSGSASLLLNRGDGTFADALYYPARNFPRTVAVSDLNGDGRLDLAVGGVQFGSNEVNLLLNTCLE